MIRIYIVLEKEKQKEEERERDKERERERSTCLARLRWLTGKMSSEYMKVLAMSSYGVCWCVVSREDGNESFPGKMETMLAMSEYMANTFHS